MAAEEGALAFNVASALTFLVGGIVAYAMSGAADVAILIPFAAGNFIYIAAADLIPQITSSTDETTPRPVATRDRIEQSVAFLVGLVLLLVAAAF